MNDRPRRGRPIAFAPATAPAPAQPDSVAGLRFTIDALYGGTVLIDMTRHNPRAIAIAFAGALRRLAALGGSIGAANGIKDYLLVYRHFFDWLADEAPGVTGLIDLRMVHIDDFTSDLEQRVKSDGRRYVIVSKLIYTLREIEADRPDSISPDLHERLRFTKRTAPVLSTPRDAYSPYVARALRDAARTDIEAIFRRVGAQDQTDLVDPAITAARAAIERIMARDGVIKADHLALISLFEMRGRRNLPTATLIDELHGAHYLLGRDLPALLVLLALETGLEPECLKTLTVDCLTNPSAGTAELRYFKRRARGAEHKNIRVRDGGIGTPGGLIRRLIDVTAAARQRLPSDCLWVYHNAGGLRAGIRIPAQLIASWVRRHGIVDDDGAPLRLLLSRLRKTHKALWYTKTGGHMTRFAVGHSREVAARHYADLPSLRHLHEETVADAFRAVVAAALPTVLSSTAEQALREAPEQAASLISPDMVGPLLDGEHDVWLAACAGFYSSPFTEAGLPCAHPFWGCLDCPNAVITRRKLPAILAFQAFVEGKRQSLMASDWAAMFGRAHARITEQILPVFSDAVIADARQEMGDALLYLPPEVRA